MTVDGAVGGFEFVAEAVHFVGVGFGLIDDFYVVFQCLISGDFFQATHVRLSSKVDRRFSSLISVVLKLD